MDELSQSCDVIIVCKSILVLSDNLFVVGVYVAEMSILNLGHKRNGNLIIPDIFHTQSTGKLRHITR